MGPGGACHAQLRVLGAMQQRTLCLAVLASALLSGSLAITPASAFDEVEDAGVIAAADAAFSDVISGAKATAITEASQHVSSELFALALPAVLRPKSGRFQGQELLTLKGARDFALRAAAANAPKVELHAHLDGSMTPSTIWHIGQAVGFKFPEDVHNAEDLIPYVTAEHAASLADFLKTFDFFYPIISGGSAAIAMEMMAEAFVKQQMADNVIYSEVRFAPQLLTAENVTSQMLIDAAWRGLRKGMKEDSGADIRLLLCCYRNLPAAACSEIVELAAANPEKVVGVDLAGDEMGYSNEPWIVYFEDLFKRGIHRTVHSGESGTNATRDCETALTEMHAERIGHGYHCLASAKAVGLLQKHEVHIEACPSSSVGTRATGPLGPDHPIAHFAELGLNFGLNTDDAGVLRTNMTHEFDKARDLLGFSLAQQARATKAAAAHVFAPASERASLLRKVQDYWSTIRALAPKSSTFLV